MKFEKQFPNTVFAAIILIICSIIIAAPFIYFTDFLLLYFDQTYIDRFIALLVFLFILLLAFFINWKKGNSISYSFKLPTNLSLIALSLLIVITLQIGINSVLATGINTLLNNQYPLKNPFNDTNFSLFSTILLAPFFEELIFRGTILRGFLSNYSVLKSIIYSTAIFGLIHYAPATVICAILLGLFFGWLYYKTGSIALTILLHATANLTALVAGYFRYHIADNSSWYNIYGKYSILILFLSILFLILSFIQLIKLSKKENISVQ